MTPEQQALYYETLAQLELAATNLHQLGEEVYEGFTHEEYCVRATIAVMRALYNRLSNTTQEEK